MANSNCVFAKSADRLINNLTIRYRFLSVFFLFISGGATAFCQNWNPAHAIGTITGKYEVVYNQYADPMTELSPAAHPQTGLSYLWEFSASPLSGFGNAPGPNSGVSYTYPNPVLQNLWFRRKTTYTNGAFVFSNTIKISLVSSTWDDINYVREIEVKTTGVQSFQQIDALPNSQKEQSTTYFDGIGRVLQRINTATASPQSGGSQWGDQVNIEHYDAYGRATKQYLTYATVTNPGKYKTNTIAEQQQYYSTVYNETSAFHTVTFDNSPLEKIRNVKQAGTTWSASAGFSQWREMNGVNDEVHKFDVDYIQGNGPVHAGVYDNKTLFKDVQTDVGGKQIIEFSDKFGRIILKKVQLEDNPASFYSGWICTYYIYDEFGQLRHVLQPEAVKYLANNSWSFAGTNGQQVLNELCFFYDYDVLGRMIWKKAPGAMPLKMLYDKRDRLVFTQDGNQAAMSTPQWTVTLYDELDRPIITALYNTFTSQAQLQTNIDNAPASTTMTVYTNGVAPVNVTMSLCPIVSTINNSDYTSIIKYNFYDHYNFTGVKTFNTGYTNLEAYSTTDPNVQSITWSKRTMNFPTGSITRALGTTTFLSETNYFDERGDLVQTLMDNIKSGVDILTSQYHFDGRVLSQCSDHTVAAAGYTNFKTLNKYLFDQLGRVTSIVKKIGSNDFREIVSYSYDDFGRLKTKTFDPTYIGGGNQGLETLNYSYNIQGNITGINKDYALKTPGVYDKWEHFFGLYLGYDNRDNVFTSANLTGRVGGILWSTLGDDVQRRYDFSYDNAGRLINALFKERKYPGDAWNNTKMDFTVSGVNGKIAYDLNSNILEMSHKGIVPGTVNPILVDDLRYTYANLSNKVVVIKDEMTTTSVNGKLGDFKDGSNGAGTNDYVYDANGNLVVDLNKNVQSLIANGYGIVYNHLDKPEQIKISGKGVIKIVYSADGSKLQRVFIPEAGSGQTESVITTYIQEFVYQETSTTLTTSSTAPFNGSNLSLSFFSFEEGRIRVITPTSQSNGFDLLTVDGDFSLPNGKKGAIDFFVTDYQQNVRMILTQETRFASNMATMESSRSSVEAPVFGQVGSGNEVETTRWTKPTGWTNNSSNSVSRLGNLSGKNLGPNTLQKVMAGDAVSAQTTYYFQNQTGGSNTGFANAVVGSLLQTIVGGGAATGLIKDNASAVTNQLGSTTGFVNALQNPGSGGATPLAFLTIIFLDERFNYIPPEEGGVYQQQVLSSWSTSNQPLVINQVQAPKNGYMFAFISNRSDQDVYFDDFQVSINNGRIIEENHYYAYGLKIAGISSKRASDTYDGQIKNNRLYNDKELWDEGELNWYDYGFRNYDPQIGRFIQLDPLTNFYTTLSPYQYASCDPIMNIDIDGLEGASSIFTVINGAVESGKTVLQEIIITAPRKAVQKTAAASSSTAKITARLALITARGTTDALYNANTLGMYDFFGGNHLNEYKTRDEQIAYLRGRVAGDLLAIAQGGVQIKSGTAAMGVGLATGGIVSAGGALVASHGAGVGVAASIDMGKSLQLLHKLNASATAGGDAGSSGSNSSGSGKTSPKNEGTNAANETPKKALDVVEYAAKNKGAAKPGYKGGGNFANDGRGGGQVLPKTDSKGNPIKYKEYDVNPYQKGVNRGTERVVIGNGKAYYTNNHYKTFTLIK